MSFLSGLGLPTSLTSVIGLAVGMYIFKTTSSSMDPAMAQWTPQFLAYAGDLIALVASQLAAAYAGVKAIEAAVRFDKAFYYTYTGTPQPEISSASGSSSPWSSSSPGPSVSPSLDTLRVLSSGKDTRPWRPSVKPSQLLRDTSTSPLVASLVSAPGSPASPSVTLLRSSSTSSTSTRTRLMTKPPIEAIPTPLVPESSTTSPSTSCLSSSPTRPSPPLPSVPMLSATHTLDRATLLTPSPTETARATSSMHVTTKSMRN